MSAGVAIDLPVHRSLLACGAKLVVSPRPGSPVTAVQMHMRGGSALDPPGREGTAYLAGALLDQGTRARSEEEIATLLETSGGSVSGDAHGVSGTIAAEATALLIELVCELVSSPAYPLAEFRTQKQRLLDRLLVERDDPRAQSELFFRKLVYGDHWLGRAPYGTLESVRRIERRHVAEFHRARWMPARALLAVCGDVDPAQVRAQLEKGLARWQGGDDSPPPPPRFPEPGVRVDAFRAAREQVHLYLGHLGIRRNDPDYPVLVVMDHVLGTGPGFTNRIAMKLRDELGLAYSVSASIHGSAGVHPGTFAAYIGTSPQHVRTAIEGFLREIRRIQEEPVGEAELLVAKSYVVGSFALSFQRAARRASYLISAERHQLPEDNLSRLPAQFAQVTCEDVQRVARAHLFPDRCCVAAGGPISREELAAMVGAPGAARAGSAAKPPRRGRAARRG